MRHSEYGMHDAIGLADLVRRGEISPGELVDTALAAVAALNGKINAVILDMGDIARQAAKGTLPDGPFRGVPFLLKDITLSYAGVPTSCGSRFFRGWTRPYDSEMVRRWKAAGLVIIGKTNTPEAGSSPSTEPVAFGATHNPWNLDHIAGGSSGGSGAAVAAGMVPVAHANDGGGSIRIPASCCGLVGLKPSRGRASNGPDIGELMSGAAVEHVVSRSVRDSAALLDLECPPAPGDPYFAPLPTRPYRREVGADPGRLRIGLSTASPLGTPVDPVCVKAAEDAAKLLAELGHQVEPAAPALDAERTMKAWTTLFFANAAKGIDDHAARTGIAPTGALLEANSLHILEAGRRLTARDLLAASDDINTATRDLARFFQTYDLWLTPTLGAPPPRLGYLSSNADPAAFFERMLAFIPFTPLANCTGNPAISLPLSWSDDGLPVGIHLTARYADEAMLIRVAAQLEQARPWRNRRPPTGVWTI